MYALTNPEGLNLGRQTGIHDDEAGEFMIDGECIVLRRMWMSDMMISYRSRNKVKCLPAGWMECFLGLINVITLPLATKSTYRIS